MTIHIAEEPIATLADYGQTPIAFEVTRRFRVDPVDGGIGGLRLVEEAVDPPYTKDYDGERENGPERWLKRWDTSNWVLLAARDADQRRIGGAVVVFHTPDMGYTEGRQDLAGLLDIRVEPAWRGKGAGRALWQRVEQCARARGCAQLKVETQNINVDACRFYARMGAVLGYVHRHAYRADGLDEVELTWYKEL